jgi:hypothetical protein
LTTHVSGTLPIANGGTNLTATPTDGQLLIGNTAGSGYTLATLTAGTNVSITNGAGSISIATSAAPSFATSVTTPTVYGGTSASASLTLQSTSGAGTTDSILFKVGNNGATTAMSIASGGTVTIGTLSLTNPLGVASGGTGLSATPLNGQIDIGNGTNFTRTTISSGTGVSVTNGAGTITIANTGVTSNVAGTGISVSGATGAVTITNSGVTSIVAGTGITISGATGAVTISSSSGSNVSSISFGSTGLTPATATTGVVTVAGTLAVANGGTGVTSSTGTGSNVLSASPTFTGTLNAAAITASGAITDSIGNVRDVPQNAQTAAYVLVATDNGKHIAITTGGITVNSGIFSAGQSVTVYNNSASSQTITQGTSVTMYLVGTATTGNRTLAQRGLCTIFCVASNTFVITGGGLT